MPFEEFEIPPTPPSEEEGSREEKFEEKEEFDHEKAWEIREEMKDITTASNILEGLAGLDSNEAWEMREELKKEGSREALAKSLAGLDSERAWEMREELKKVFGKETPLDLSRSLIGLDSEKAWEWREEELKKIEELKQEEVKEKIPEERIDLGVYILSSSLAESFTGLDSEKAWEWREKLKGKMPIGVAEKENLPLPIVESLAGLDSEKAWSLREEIREEIEFLKNKLAGKKMELETPLKPIKTESAILIPVVDKHKLKKECFHIETTIAVFSSSLAKSLAGLESEKSWKLREELLKEAPQAVAESLTGLDSEKAWEWREKLKEIGPAGVAKSLAGLNSEKAWALREELKKKKSFGVVLGLESNPLLEAIKAVRKKKEKREGF
jgi:dTMP kinase